MLRLIAFTLTLHDTLQCHACFREWSDLSALDSVSKFDIELRQGLQDYFKQFIPPSDTAAADMAAVSSFA